MCAEGSHAVNGNFRLQQDLPAIGRVLAAYREERNANDSEGHEKNRTGPLDILKRKPFGHGLRFPDHWKQYKSEIAENGSACPAS